MKSSLIKYNLVKIIPFEDTFYHCETLPKEVHLKEELLKLNYIKYAPFSAANLLHALDGKHLMLWFYKTKLQAKSIIPESYMLFKELKKQNKDAVYIIKGTIYKILVIKNHKLLGAYTLKELDLDILRLNLAEYQVKTEVYIEEHEYAKLYKTAKERLTLNDIYRFHQLSFSSKGILQRTINATAYPLSMLLFFYMALNYTHGIYLENIIEQKKIEYVDAKDKNSNIKKQISKHNKDVKKWTEFITDELIYPDSIAILKSLYSIKQEDEEVIFRDLSISGSKVTLKLATNMNPVIFLNRLSSISYFDRVIIGTIHKPRDGKKVIAYEIEIKALEAK